MDKKKFEYIIGIDLGHGETSAAICPLQWDQEDQQLEPVKDLEMGGNTKVIPSAITILDDGTAYIGESAFNTDILKKASVRVCFKQAPKDIEGEAEQLMIRFMKEVYLRIRNNNTGLLQDGNHLVYIATPSGWNKEQQDMYVEMAKQAGIPIAGVTKESRAAFVRAQQDITSGLGRKIHKGAIVFDMGSSTLDFTYMNDAIAGLIDFGYDCGASHVEKAIYAQKREENEIIQEFEKKYPKLVDKLLFEARVAKEKVYFSPKMKYKKTINFEDFIDDEEFEDEKFKFVFEPGQLDDFLKEEGYIQQIEEAMLDFRNAKIPGQKIYGVFLTGGASRMDFIRDLVCKCWDVTPEQVYRDTDPSLTISQGVAEVARIDLRSEGQDVSIAKEIERLERSNQIFESFAGTFTSSVHEQVVQAIVDTFVEFRDSATDRSANYLQTKIKNNVRDVVTAQSRQASEYLQNAIDTETAALQKQVDAVVMLYSRQGTQITKPKINVSNLNMGNINLDTVIKQLSDQIVDNSIDWLGLGGLGLAAFLFGIPGLLVGWGLGKLFGDSEEEKKAKAMKKDLDSDARIQLCNNFVEKWEQDGIENKIYNQIEKSIKGNNTIKYEISTALTMLLEAYKKELKNARIMVE